MKKVQVEINITRLILTACFVLLGIHWYDNWQPALGFKEALDAYWPHGLCVGLFWVLWQHFPITITFKV